MSINKVEVNDYSNFGPHEAKVIITEFCGRMVIEIKEGSKAQVYFDDIQRAWNAVKRF